MATGMWQGCLLRLFVLSVLSQGVCSWSLANRERICAQFRNKYCLRSPICRAFYKLFQCNNTAIEPECGLSSVSGSASNYPMPRIVGGTPAIDREFPWTVYVSVGCGGSILNRRTILSAAHCLQSFVNRASLVEVGYGSNNKSSLTYITASRVLVHPDFNAENRDNDLAVIKLSRDLPLSDETNLRPLCLPTRRATYPAGRNCMITGWGVTAESGSQFPEILQKAVVPLVPLDQCEALYRQNPFLFVSQRQLCAGYVNSGGVDACYRDSGSPLFCADGDRWVIEGVVSAGVGCARPALPGIYAYVPQHIPWINAVMALAK